MNKSKFTLLAAGLMSALAFVLSCSSDGGNDDNTNGDSSSSSSEQVSSSSGDSSSSGGGSSSSSSETEQGNGSSSSYSSSSEVGQGDSSSSSLDTGNSSSSSETEPEGGSSSSENAGSSSSGEAEVGNSSSSVAWPVGDVVFWGNNPFVESSGWDDMEEGWEWYVENLPVHFELITNAGKDIFFTTGAGYSFIIVPQSLGTLARIENAGGVNIIEGFTLGNIKIWDTDYYIYKYGSSTSGGFNLTLKY